MICATCDGEMRVEWATIPIIGSVCGRCSERLFAATTLEGCVAGPAVATLARATHDEFERRRANLIEVARGLCKGET